MNIDLKDILTMAQESGFVFDKYGCVQCDMDGSLDADAPLTRFAQKIWNVAIYSAIDHCDEAREVLQELLDE